VAHLSVLMVGNRKARIQASTRRSSLVEESAKPLQHNWQFPAVSGIDNTRQKGGNRWVFVT
jgi:hypothetical protein